MNANLLSSLEQQSAELDASRKEDLAVYTDRQLDMLLVAFLLTPKRSYETFKKHPERLTTLAAATIQRERLRRAEIAAMGDGQ